MKRPSLQFYPGDWLRDTPLQSCSLAARGLWIQLLCFMHDGEPYGHLAVDGKAIAPRVAAQMVGVELKTYNRLQRELKAKQVLSSTRDGVLFSRRMVRDEELRQVRAAGGVRALEHPNHPAKKVYHQGRAEGRNGGSTPAVAVAVAVAEDSKTKPSAPRGAAGEAGLPETGTAVSQRVTWLTPFVDTWVRTYGGAPACGELGRHLKPLLEGRAVGEVLDHWARYLGETAPEYVSPARFAQTFGRWGKEARAVADTRPDMYLTLEEQEARRVKARGNGKAGPTYISESISLP